MRRFVRAGIAAWMLVSAGASASAQICAQNRPSTSPPPLSLVGTVVIALTLSEELESPQLIATLRGQPSVPVLPDATGRWSLILDGAPLQPVTFSSLALSATGRSLNISKEGWVFEQSHEPQARFETIGGAPHCVVVVTYSGVKVWKARVSSLVWLGPERLRLLERETNLPVVCEQGACGPNSQTAFESNWLTARDTLAMIVLFGRCSPRIAMGQINVARAFTKSEIIDEMIKDNCAPKLEDLAKVPNEIAVTPLPRRKD